MATLLYIYKLILKLEAIKREYLNLMATKKEYLKLMKNMQVPEVSLSLSLSLSLSVTHNLLKTRLLYQTIVRVMNRM